MGRAAPALVVSAEQRRVLEAWVRAPSTPQAVATRARLVLAAANGVATSQIARDLGVSRPTVRLWRQRFGARGPTGLTEIQPGRGRKPQIPAATIRAIVAATLHTTPPGATHWSCRSIRKSRHGAADLGRPWPQAPPRAEIKLSRDPAFVAKLTDVVGLYLNPPDQAVVLCVDEKSQIQALDRTQPGLPMKRGRAGTMTHDYQRHGPCSPRSTCWRARSSGSACRATTRSSSRSCAGSTASSRRGCLHLIRQL